MGFNKRFLSREKIMTVYSQGLPKLVQFIENTDCLIFEDDFSEEISDIILNYDYHNKYYLFFYKIIFIRLKTYSYYFLLEVLCWRPPSASPMFKLCSILNL